MLSVELESLGLMLSVNGNSLYIGNERDEGVYLDDLRSLESTEVYKRVIQLEKELIGAITELKELCLNELRKDNDIKGVIDGVKEVA
ncbi:hypothetical protein N5S92_05320 [Aliarcobacter cryaerophilus]|uniref:hypothetical protein n=1 Tax=Aliarcobacter cryaerophilus TaxID=28198 RepID=UPI0021B29C6B|nr:hypothetical protein [Aliarcobacter cryaerophilus]MCT7501401.1 hypothetical protein [Aliarcobacter cryaerophilus]